jgi:hypothetical protein
LVKSDIDAGVVRRENQRRVLNALSTISIALKVRYAVGNSLFLASDAATRFYIGYKGFVFPLVAVVPVMSITCNCMSPVAQGLALGLGTMAATAAFGRAFVLCITDEEIDDFESPIPEVIESIDGAIERIHSPQGEQV